MSFKSFIKKTSNSSFPSAMMQLVHLRHISGWKDLINHLQADNIGKKIKTNSSPHIFFVAGMPKSGTTWMEQLLACTPGLVQLNGSTIRNYPRKIDLKHPHDLDLKMLECAPKEKLSFLIYEKIYFF